MRVCGYFLFALVWGGSLLAQPAPDAATAVASGFLETVTKAWEARDGRAYAAAFWPDAEIVNVFGGVMNGEEVIAASSLTLRAFVSSWPILFVTC